MRSSLAVVLIIIIVILVILTVVFSCKKSSTPKTDNYESKTEKLIGKYKDIEPLCPGRSITILTFTESIENIRKTVSSLLEQSCSVNQLIMTVPSNRKINLPDDLKKVINVYESGKDYGEIGNSIVPTLLREAESDTIVIIVKTGTIYNKNFLRDMLSILRSEDRAVFKMSGCILSTGMLSPSVLKSKIDTFDQLETHVIR